MQVHKTPSLISSLYSKLIWSVDAEDTIYLTFDDGPHPDITSWVLEQLALFEAEATFFCVGENIKKYPHVAEQAAKQGHLLANHTFNHLKGWNTSNHLYLQNIAQCDVQIQQVQPKVLPFFRPPYGRIKRSQIRQLKPNYDIVMWSHLSWDFDVRLDRKRSIRHLTKSSPGSILVFHDSIKAFENLKAILPPVLRYFQEKRIKMKVLS